jgi:hypothetical protein
VSRTAFFLRSLAALLLCGSALTAAPRPAPLQDAQGTTPAPWAARLGETTVSFEELDRLLLGRHALSKEGRATMLFLLKLRVIEFLASEGGVVATQAEVQALMDEVESGVVAAGKAASLVDYLRQEGIAETEFKESIRLSVLQRELTRRALGIPQGEPVSGEQQEVWLESRISELGLEEFDAPWDGGLVLRCAGVTLGRDEFLAFLRTRLDPAQVREAMVDLLRVKRMRARMPDLSAEAFARSVEEEIQGRRNEVMSDPQYQGIPYEQLLESQGILFATWPEDPSLQQAALARTWVERKYDEEALRRVYEDERELFDSRYGEAIETWVLYLRAAEVKNELIRDYAEAEAILAQAREATRSKAEFLQRIQLLSEDKSSREKEGLLGWITRPTTESPTREAIFEALDSGTYQPGAAENSLSRMVGPVRTQSGVLLLWLGSRRPAPAWPTMVVYVARELRHRFVDDSLDPRQVQTFLDPK